MGQDLKLWDVWQEVRGGQTSIGRHSVGKKAFGSAASEGSLLLMVEGNFKSERIWRRGTWRGEIRSKLTLREEMKWQRRRGGGGGVRSGEQGRGGRDMETEVGYWRGWG